MEHGYFNESTDGEAEKKKEVANHKYRCRNCQHMSCRGCGQDAGGDEFNAHNVCGSEKGKDSGKCSVQNKNGNKKTKTKQSRNTLRASVKTLSLNPDLAPALRTNSHLCKPLKLEHHLLEEAVDIFSKVRQEFIESLKTNKKGTVRKNNPESSKMEPEETAEPSVSKSVKQRKRKNKDSLENGDGRLSGESLLAKKRNAKDHGRQIGAGDANGADVDKEVATDVEVPSKKHKNKKKKNRDAAVLEAKADDVENDVRNGDRKKKGRLVDCNESLQSEQTVTEEADNEDSQAKHEGAVGKCDHEPIANASDDGLWLKELQKKSVSNYQLYCGTDKVQQEAVKLKELSNLTLDVDQVTIVK